MFPRARTPDGEIEGAGGAYVRRRFTFSGKELVNGDRLTAAEIAGIPDNNLRSLINLNIIELFPKSPNANEEYKVKLAGKDEEIANLRAALENAAAPPPPVGDGDCFLMPAETGPGFHIIQGRQVTTEPLSRAKALAKMKELT